MARCPLFPQTVPRACRTTKDSQRRAKGRRIRLIRGGKDPIKGQNSQQPGMGYLALPATSRIFAGDFHFAEDLHGLVLRERGLRALALQIDVVPIFGARKNYSVGFTHTL